MFDHLVRESVRIGDSQSRNMVPGRIIRVSKAPSAMFVIYKECLPLRKRGCACARMFTLTTWLLCQCCEQGTRDTHETRRDHRQICDQGCPVRGQPRRQAPAHEASGPAKVSFRDSSVVRVLAILRPCSVIECEERIGYLRMRLMGRHS